MESRAGILPQFPVRVRPQHPVRLRDHRARPPAASASHGVLVVDLALEHLQRPPRRNERRSRTRPPCLCRAAAAAVQSSKSRKAAELCTEPDTLVNLRQPGLQHPNSIPSASKFDPCQPCLSVAAETTVYLSFVMASGRPSWHSQPSSDVRNCEVFSLDHSNKLHPGQHVCISQGNLNLVAVSIYNLKRCACISRDNPQLPIGYYGQKGMNDR